jgi:hypothetical protein
MLHDVNASSPAANASLTIERRIASMGYDTLGR